MNQEEDENEFDYTNVIKMMGQVKKEVEPEEENLSDDFQYEEKLDDEHHDFVIPPKEMDSVSIDATPYDSIQIVKPKVQVQQLPPLSRKLLQQSQRKFSFKNVEINQQMLKYETLTYEIESYIHEENKSTVTRQYSDFEWLFQELFENFPGVIIPSIPSRHLLAKLNIHSYTNVIRAQRQKGLEEFLRKVLCHQILCDCEIIEKFMTLPDQEFKRLMNDYQVLKQGKLTLKIGSFIGKIGSMLFSSANQESELERFFNFVLNELQAQKIKLKSIKDNIESTFVQKLEQSKHFSIMANLFEDMCSDISQRDNIPELLECSSNALKDAVQEMTQHLYILDVLLSPNQQCLLDMDVVINVIKQKNDLTQLISDHAAALNSTKYTVINNFNQTEQKALIQTQLNEHQRNLSKLIDNFKPEFEVFSTQFNSTLNQIIYSTLNQWTSVNQQFYQLWN